MLTKSNRSYKARLHDLAEKMENGSVHIRYAPTELLPADSLTKATGKVKHAKHFEATKELQKWVQEQNYPKRKEEGQDAWNHSGEKRARYL